jgi:hypothetical protein
LEAWWEFLDFVNSFVWLMFELKEEYALTMKCGGEISVFLITKGEVKKYNFLFFVGGLEKSCA